jgi:hypothetical protein
MDELSDDEKAQRAALRPVHGVPSSAKRRVHQLTQNNRVLDERLHAARSNLRFQDRRLADLEAKLLEPPT